MFTPPKPVSDQPVATFDSLDLVGLAELASLIVQSLPSGIVLGLVGTLGAGKTTFVQSIAQAAQIDAEEVTSPTFTLLQSHSGKITLHHLDVYRLADEDEFLELGVEELFEDPMAWTLIEWADRMQSVLPSDAVWIHLELTDHDERRRVRRQDLPRHDEVRSHDRPEDGPQEPDERERLDRECPTARWRSSPPSRLSTSTAPGFRGFR